MLDCLILGGGIVGLSIAENLLRRGKHVQVIDRTVVGKSASWAAAGILPPPGLISKDEPSEQLRLCSHRLFPDWVRRLEDTTNTSIGFERCGGLYVSRQMGESVSLHIAIDAWKSEGVCVECLELDDVRKFEPKLRTDQLVGSAFFLPDEQQVRPTRLLKALKSVVGDHCIDECNDCQLISRHGVCCASIGGRIVEAKSIVVCAGPWSNELLLPFGVDIGVEPIRGQMVMWNPGQRFVHHIINEGPRYVLSRNDGRLLAGSTVEEVGFDCRNTTQGIDELAEFARELIPDLGDHAIEKTWAGLRPASRDGVPSIGKITGVEGLFLATGHFRSGIHMAPGTAECLARLICEEEPLIDLSPFAPRRN